MDPLVDLKLDSPWLVAAWPGMGGVAQIAGRYLIEKLIAAPIADLQAGRYFDVNAVDVKDGIVRPAAPPASRFYGWRNPNGRDLVVFIGDQQAVTQGREFCDELLGVASELGVTRVFTFAAMGTPIRPKAVPRVFAVGSRAEVLEEIGGSDVEILREGQIRGLNGVLVSAAAERGLDGVCLLGEFPFFASTVPNPKASAAVLRVFARAAGLELDLTEIDSQAREIERNLEQHFIQLETQAQQQARAQGESGEPWSGHEERLREKERQRIERLFDEARGDRSKAMDLKAELDRQGIFKRYEDRFLDLFRDAE